LAVQAELTQRQRELLRDVIAALIARDCITDELRAA
jgi:hypothetical protein